MFIRKFQYSDLIKVYEIERMCFPDPYDMDILLKLFELGFGFLVAEENNNVLGYILFSVNMECEGHLISIAVDKNYRGCKVGSRLLSSAISIYIQTGINRIQLEVRTHNTRAIKFYESFGFVIDRKEFNYYIDGSDAYIMYLNLPS